METEFESPQTGSVYQTVAERDGIGVMYRAIGQGQIRVRVQYGTEGGEDFDSLDSAPAVRDALLIRYGAVKEGDHQSITVAAKDAGNAIGEAVRALVNATIKSE